jgi:hypothetical protein
MTMGATQWNPVWETAKDAAAAGYGQVRWTATQVYTNELVWWRAYSQGNSTQPIQYVDFIWDISTSSSTSQFVFVNNNAGAGNDSNAGTLSSPLASIAGAFGSTFAAATAFVGAQCILRGSATEYPMPAYTDNNQDTTIPYLEYNPNSKPVWIRGYPGETATIDATTAMIMLQGLDTGISDVTFNGFASSVTSFGAVNNFRLITHSNHRQTLQNVIWTNGGPGVQGGNVATMVYKAAGPVFNYITHTALQDNSHAPTNAGYDNNYSGSTMYSANYYGCWLCSADSPTASSSGAWYAKGGCTNAFLWANYANFGGCEHAFDWGQMESVPSEGNASGQSCFNVGINVQAINASQVSGAGPFSVVRNTLIAGAGRALFTADANDGGNKTIARNVVQTSFSPVPNTGTAVTSIGNLVAVSGLVNSDGTLISPDGTAGAKIQ